MCLKIQPPPFNILASPSSQILTAAQTHLRPVPKEYVFDPTFEEKIFHNDKEYVIPKKFIEAYNERIKIEKKLKEEKEEQYKDLINSKKKFQKSEKKKQQLIFNERVTKFSSAQNLTRETKRKIFEAIGIDAQRPDDRRQAKSNAELINELKKNTMFVDFIEGGGDDPKEFLKLIERPIEIKTVPTSIIDTIKKISQTPPQTPKRPQHPSLPYLTPIKKGPVDLSKVSVFMTPEKIEEEDRKAEEARKKIRTR